MSVSVEVPIVAIVEQDKMRKEILRYPFELENIIRSYSIDYGMKLRLSMESHDVSVPDELKLHTLLENGMFTYKQVENIYRKYVMFKLYIVNPKKTNVYSRRKSVFGLLPSSTTYTHSGKTHVVEHPVNTELASKRRYCLMITKKESEQIRCKTNIIRQLNEAFNYFRTIEIPHCSKFNQKMREIAFELYRAVRILSPIIFGNNEKIRLAKLAAEAEGLRILKENEVKRVAAVEAAAAKKAAAAEKKILVAAKKAAAAEKKILVASKKTAAAEKKILVAAKKNGGG